MPPKYFPMLITIFTNTVYENKQCHILPKLYDNTFKKTDSRENSMKKKRFFMKHTLQKNFKHPFLNLFSRRMCTVRLLLRIF